MILCLDNLRYMQILFSEKLFCPKLESSPTKLKDYCN